MSRQARLLEQFRVSANILKQGNETLVALTLASAARHERQFTDEVVRMLEQQFPNTQVSEIYNELVDA